MAALPEDPYAAARANGDGTFNGPVGVSSVGGTSGLAAADLNLDGKTDLAVGSGANISVLLNATDGYYNSPPRLRARLDSAVRARQRSSFEVAHE